MRTKSRWLRAASKRLNKRHSVRRNRRPLIESLERRELLFAALENVQLLNDTATPGDLITSDPRVTGTVTGDFLHDAQVEFDHDADGSAEGFYSVSVPGEQFTYDPRDVDPSLQGYSGVFPLQLRVVEFDEFSMPLTPGPWQDFTFTIETASADVPGDHPTASQNVTLTAGVPQTFTEEIGNGLHGDRDIDLYQLTLSAGQTLSVDIDAFTLDDGSQLSSLDSYLRVFDNEGIELASNDAASAPDDYATSEDSYLSFVPGSGGTYFVGVSGDANRNYNAWLEDNGIAGSVGAYQLTLLVDDPPPPPQPSLSISAGSADESAAAVSLTVSLSAASSETITVDYPTSDGTALVGADYVAAGGTLTFAPGETVKLITVSVLDDTQEEPNEHLYVTLTSPVNATIATAQAAATIVDDDGFVPPSLSFSSTAVTVNESAGSAAFTVTLSSATTQTVTVAYATSDGSATAGADYNAVNSSLAFAPGETSKTITVPILDDSDDEPNEDFYVTLSSAMNATIATSQATGTIEDNDDPLPTLSFAHAALTLPEDAGSVLLLVTLSVPSSETVTVNYASSDTSATAGSDYAAATGTLTFQPGETSRFIGVTILDDTADEVDETFRITLSSAVNATISGPETTLTIADNDEPAPIGDPPGDSFATAYVLNPQIGSPLTLSEEIGNGLYEVRDIDFFEVYLSQGERLSVDIDAWQLDDGTQLSQLDSYLRIFDASGGELAANDNGFNTNDAGYTDGGSGGGVAWTEYHQSALQDAFLSFTASAEGYYYIGISASANVAYSSTGSNSVAGSLGVYQLEVLKEAPSAAIGVSVSVADVTVNEADTVSLSISLSASSTETVQLLYRTRNGSATPHTDYAPASGTLVFSPGETQKTVDIATWADSVWEADETFSLEVTGPVDVYQTAWATIHDDAADRNQGRYHQGDYPYRHVTVENVVVDEGAAAVFTVRYSGGIDVLPFTVNYQTRNRTATASADYVLQSGTLTFDPDVRSLTVSIPTVHDWTGEPDEQFYVDFTTPWGDQPIAVATIRDTRPPQVTVEDIQVTEGDVASLTITLSEPLASPVTLNYFTSPGSANIEAANDFQAASGTLNIAAGETQANVTVQTLADWLKETDEFFYLEIAAPWGFHSVAQATIQDDRNNIPVLSFDGDLVVQEGDTATLGITLNKVFDTAVTVSVSSWEGTATGCSAGYCEDYQDFVGSVVFLPGETHHTIAIETLSDWKIEGNEELFFELSSTMGIHDVAMVTILDEPLPDVAVTSSLSVNGGEVAVFTVTLSAPLDRTATVYYGAEGGTAYGGCVDYCQDGAEVVFAPGQVSKTFAIQTVAHEGGYYDEYGVWQDDGYTEPNLLFFVRVSAPWDDFSVGKGTIVYEGGPLYEADPLPQLVAENDTYEVRHDLRPGLDEEASGFALYGYFNVTDNDHYAGGGWWGAVFVTSLVDSQVANGTLSLFPDGSFKYVPHAGFVGTESFRYVVTDGIVTSQPATVTINVTNDAPQAVDDAFHVWHDTFDNWSGFGVLYNDVDLDPLKAYLDATHTVQHGELEFFPNGKFKYTPHPGFTGTDSFGYVATDGLAFHSGVVTLEVHNDLPIAQNDGGFTATTGGESNPQDYALVAWHDSLDNWSSFSVLDNDYQPPIDESQYYFFDGETTHYLSAGVDALRAVIFSQPQHGHVELFPNGKFNYTPEPGFVGSDWFAYVVTDGPDTSDPAIVRIRVDNDLPDAHDDPFDQRPCPGCVAGIGYSVWTHAETGPAQQYSGNNGGFYVWNDDHSWTADLIVDGVGVLHNDADQDPLSVELASCAAGRVELASDGSFQYYAPPGFSGDDAFTYRVTDGVVTDTRTVRVSVYRGDSALEETHYLSFEQGLVRDHWLGSFRLDNADSWWCQLNQPSASQPRPVGAQYLDTIVDGGTTTKVFGGLRSVSTQHGAPVPIEYVWDTNQRAWIAVYQGPDGTVSYDQWLSDYLADWTNLATSDVSTVPGGIDQTSVDYNGSTTQFETVRIEYDAQNDLFSLGADTFHLLQAGEPGWSDTLAQETGARWYTDGAYRFIEFYDTASPRVTYYDVGLPLATINWGDGASSQVNYSVADLKTLFHEQFFDPVHRRSYRGGQLDLVAGHVYATPGTYTINVSITGLLHDITSLQHQLRYYDTISYDSWYADVGSPLVTAASESVVGTEAQLFSGVVATFTDEDLLDPAGSYSAWIDWGDGLARSGVVTGSSGAFSVTASHLYDNYGDFALKARIVDKDRREHTAFSLASIANVPPTAAPDSYTTSHGHTLVVDDPLTGTLVNDTDPGSTLLNAQLVDPPLHGALTLWPDGTFVYQPNGTFLGNDTFTYQAEDGRDASSPATVTIQVTNDPPLAVDDDFIVPHDATTTLELRANDADFDNDALTVVILTQPANGTATVTAEGTVEYTPNQYYLGPDTFTYLLDDAFTQGNTATVALMVKNDPPELAPIAAQSVDEETLLTFTVSASDPDDTVLTYTLVDPVEGMQLDAASGQFTWTPTESQGPGQFTVTFRATDNGVPALSDEQPVVFTVKEVNRNPVAANDSATVDEGSVVSVLDGGALSVLLNDTDPDIPANALTVRRIVSHPLHGRATLNIDGTFTYTHDGSETIADSFIYEIRDGAGGLATGTVNLAINPLNDAPLPAADAYVATEDQVLDVSAPGVLTNDTDAEGDPLTVTLVTNAANGTVVLQSDGSFVYTPNADFFGADSFTYRVEDDSAAGNVATVAITVLPVNDDPSGSNDSVTAAEDTTLNLTVAELVANDAKGPANENGQTLTIIDVSPPAHGVATLNGDGTISYIPDADYNGVDSFVYTLQDNGVTGAQVDPKTSTATVTVNVTEVNDVPTASDDADTTPEDTALLLLGTDLLANDSTGPANENGQQLTILAVGTPAHGTAVLNADATITYTPPPDFNGVDTFTYTIEDDGTTAGVSSPQSASGTVTITVTPVNDAPVAANDSYSTDEDSPLSVPASGILANDNDVEGTALTAYHVAGPSNGTLSLSGDGSFLYTPSANFEGTDSFTYFASDGELDSNIATVTITVVGVNDLPTGSDGAVTAVEDTPYTFTLADFDFQDVDGDQFQGIRTQQSALGTLRLAGLAVAADQPIGRAEIEAGQLTYHPETNGEGIPYTSFEYHLFDGSAYSLNASTMTVNVTAVNDIPTISDVSDQTINEDGSITVSFQIEDVEDAAGSLAVTATSSNSVLLPPSGIVHGGSGAIRSVTLQPALNESGQTVVTLTVTDLDGSSATDTFTLTVNPVNDAAAISGLSDQTVDEDQIMGPLAFTVSDPEVAATELTVTATSSNTALVPSDATHIVLAGTDENRSITITPAANQYGSTVITVRVTDDVGDWSEESFILTVNPVNDLPTSSDAAVTATEDLLYVFAVSAFPFSDVETATLRKARIDSLPAAGQLLRSGVPVAPGDELTASDIASGLLRFQPEPNAFGSPYSSFTFSVSDGTGYSAAPSTMTINVNPVNDRPTISSIAAQTVDEDTTLGPIAFSVADVESVAGALTVTAASSNTQVIPTGNIVLGGAANNRTLTITPAADAHGASTITIQVTDPDSGSATRSFVVTVNAVNDLPVGGNATITATEDVVYFLSPGSFPFTDVETGSLQKVRIDSLPASGSLSRNGLPVNAGEQFSASQLSNGHLRFLSNLNGNGSPYTTFTFSVSDGVDFSAESSTMTVNVTPQNDPPTGGSSAVTTAEDTPYVFELDDFPFTDIDQGDEIQGIRTTGDPLPGTLKLDGNAVSAWQSINRADILAGKLSYHPVANGYGTPYTFIPYQVFDGTTYSATSWLTVNVTPANDPPAVVDDTYSVGEDATLNVSGTGVLGNDSDPEGDPFTAVLVSRPRHGSLSLEADGSFVYAPEKDFHGTDVFTYVAEENGVYSAVATVTINVAGINDAPSADDEDLTVAAGGQLKGHLSYLDVDYTTINATILDSVDHGTLHWRTNGTFLYLPAPGFTGTDSFTYSVSDGLASDSATVTLNVVEPVVLFTLEVVDQAGTPVDSASVGADLTLRVYVEDNRDNPLGVSAAHLDVTFDPDVASVSGQPLFAGIYSSAKKGTIDRPGVVDNAGATAFSFAPIGGGKKQLFSVPFTIAESGPLTFSTRAAADHPDYYIVSYGDNEPVDTALVHFGEVTIEAQPRSPWQNPVNPLDVDNNGFVNFTDYHLVNGYLLQYGEQTLPPISSPPAYYYDVDGDHRVTSNDRDLIFSQVADGGPAEGELVTHEGTITSFAQRDIYDYQLNAGDTLEARLSSARIEDLDLLLLGPGLNMSASYDEGDLLISITATRAGVYSLDVGGTVLGSDSIAHELTVSVEPPQQQTGGPSGAASGSNLLVHISDAVFTEGQTSNGFKVWLSDRNAPPGAQQIPIQAPRDITVHYIVTPGTADSGIDYALDPGSITIPMGASSAYIAPSIIDDEAVEPAEHLSVQISIAEGATTGDDTGTGTIDDNDQPRPTVNIGDQTYAESGGNTQGFRVWLSSSTSVPVTVTYTATDGTANSSDYSLATGTVTIPAGATQAWTAVPAIVDDVLHEGTEFFNVTLSNPVNATLGDHRGQGEIRDNDGGSGGGGGGGDTTIQIHIDDATFTEAGPNSTGFWVWLSEPAPGPVTFTFRVEDGTAVSPDDYSWSGGSETIPAGETGIHTGIPLIIHDWLEEGTEHFTVTLTRADGAAIGDGFAIGEIINAELPSLRISSETFEEGQSNSRSFEITLSKLTPYDVTVDYTVSDGTARRPDDFHFADGTVTIPANTFSASTSVVVIVDDQIAERDERFSVQLSNPQGATIAAWAGRGTGTIEDNDRFSTPLITLHDARFTEGGAASDVPFRIQVDQPVEDAFRLYLFFQEGSAVFPNPSTDHPGDFTYAGDDVDWSLQGGIFPVQFPPFQTLVEYDFPTIIDDTELESTETFSLVIHSSDRGEFARSVATGTIYDNDAGWRIEALDSTATEPFHLFCEAAPPDTGQLRVYREDEQYGGPVTILLTGEAQHGVDYAISATSPLDFTVKPDPLRIEILDLTSEVLLEVVALEDGVEPTTPDESASEDAVFSLLNNNSGSATVTIHDQQESLQIVADPREIYEGETGAFHIRPAGMPAGTTLCGTFRLVIDANIANTATPPVANWPLTDPQKATVDYHLGPPVTSLTLYDPANPDDLKYYTNWISVEEQEELTEVTIDVPAVLDAVFEEDELILAILETWNSDDSVTAHNSDTITIKGLQLQIEAVDPQATEPHSRFFCNIVEDTGRVRVYNAQGIYTGEEVWIDISGTAIYGIDYVVGSTEDFLLGQHFFVVTDGQTTQIHIPSLTEELHFLVLALDDGIQPETADESASEDATFTLQIYGDSATVTIQDPVEQLEIVADPDAIMESQTGTFWIRPSGMPEGTQLCTDFRLVIDATMENTATPPVANWPLTDPTKKDVDYDLATRDGQPISLSDYPDNPPFEPRKYKTNWLTASQVAQYPIDVGAFLDNVTEGDEVVLAILQTPNPTPEDPFQVEEHGSDQITISERILYADLEVALRNSCSCSCPVCPDLDVVTLDGSAGFKPDPIIPFRPVHLGDGAHNRTPIVRAKLDLPAAEHLPGGQLPDGIQAEFTLIKLKEGANGQLEEDTENTSEWSRMFYFPVEDNVSPGGSVAFAVQLSLPEYESNSYQLKLVATGEYDGGVPAGEIPAPVWEREEPYLYRNLENSPIAPGFEFPGYKQAVDAKAKLPDDTSGSQHSSAGQRVGPQKYRDARGLVIYNSDNSASFYQSNGDGTFKRPPETLSELSLVTIDSVQYYKLLDRYGNYELFETSPLRHKKSVDRNGNETVFHYDALGQLEKIIDSLERTTTLEFDDAGGMQKLTLTDFAQRTVLYSYDPAARELTITYPDPDDSAGPKPSPKDTVTFDGDVLGYGGGARIASIVNSDTAGTFSRTTTVHYNSGVDNRVASITRPDGSVWKLEQHRMREGLTAPGSPGQLMYRAAAADFDDFFLNQAIIIDGEENQTTFRLDHRGRVELLTDALGNDYRYEMTHTEENDRGEVVRFTAPDPDGAGGPLGALVSQFAYVNGNLISQTLPPLAGPSSEISLRWPQYNDDFDRPTEFLNELMHQTLYDVDPDNGNILSITLVEPDADPVVPRPGYTPWQNAVAYYDVDKNGTVTGFDILPIINTLNDEGPRFLGGLPGSGTAAFYYDTNGDHNVSSMDALLIINWLNTNQPSGPGPGSSPDGGATGDVGVEYVYTKLADGLPGGLIKEEKIHTGRDADGDGTPDVLVTSYDYYNAVDGAPFGSSHLYGLLQSVTYAHGTPDAATVQYFYDAFGNPALIIDELGRQTSLAFDRLDRLVASLAPDPDNSGPLLPPAVKYDYDPFDNVLAVEQINHRPAVGGDPAVVTSHVTTYQYDGMNRTTRIVEPHPDQQQVIASITSNTTLADYLNQPIPLPAGEAGRPVTQFTYDNNGNLLTAVDALGRLTQYHYDDLDRVEMVVSPDPGASHFSVAAERRNNDASAGEVDGFITSFTYDNISNLRSVTDPLGNATFYRYDAWSRLVEVIEPSTRRRFFQSENSSLQSGLRAADSWGDNLAQNDIPVTQIDYEGTYYGWQQSVTDPLGRVTTQQFDFAGRLRYLVEPAVDDQAPVTWFDYYQDGATKAVIDPYADRTDYQYDARARLKTVQQALVHDPAAGLVRPTTTLGYDAANQLVQVSDPLGRVTSYDYDQLGRQTLVTSPDPDGGGPGLSPTASYLYDAVGNVLQVTDALDHATSYGYDELWRQTSSTDANGDVTSFTYDLLGNLQSLTDANANTTAWAYDRWDRVQTETNTFGVPRTYLYDAAGNLRQATDRNGRVTEYQYDNLYRMTRESWLGPDTQRLTFVYDLVGNLLRAFDSVASYEFEYDAQDRLTTESHYVRGGGLSVDARHSYDLADNRVSYSASAVINGGVADSLKNTYAYDHLHRMIGVTQTSAGQGTGYAADKHVSFTYDRAGQMKDIKRYAAGQATAESLVAHSQFAYDNVGRLTSIVHARDELPAAGTAWDGVLSAAPTATANATMAAYHLQYDAANRLEVFNSFADQFSVDYGYDPRNQLTSAVYTDVASQPYLVGGSSIDENYAYDDNGNRLLADGVTSQSADQTDNRIQTDGTYNYEYDGEGNRTRRTEIATGEVTEYAWDHRNRLTKVTDKSASGAVTQTVEYAYDVFDRRIGKRLSDDADAAFEQSTFWIYDGAHIALEYTDQDGDGFAPARLSHRYLHGPAVDMILADEQIVVPGEPGNVLWPLTDHLGSARDLVDSRKFVRQHVVYNSFGNRVSEQHYDVFGSPISSTHVQAVDHLFGFTGREWDEDVDLQNSRARWYDPEVGGWISIDPIKDDHSNLYRYVGNAPNNSTDPSGLAEYGPYWFNNDWSDWWNPVAYISANGHWLGERIGTGWGTVFIKDHMASHDVYTARQVRALLAYDVPNGMDDCRNDVSGSAFGLTRRAVLGDGLREAGEDAYRMVDGAIAAGELGFEVVGLVEGGFLIRELATGSIRIITKEAAQELPNAWQLRHDYITARLREHLSQAVKQAKLTPSQARDVIKRGAASKHWGTQIDTRFKELVQNDPLLCGDVAVSPRRLPQGSVAPDVIDLRTKSWWDVTSTAEEFAKKPPKYGTQYGQGTSLLYAEP